MFKVQLNEDVTRVLSGGLSPLLFCQSSLHTLGLTIAMEPDLTLPAHVHPQRCAGVLVLLVEPGMVVASSRLLSLLKKQHLNPTF